MPFVCLGLDFGFVLSLIEEEEDDADESPPTLSRAFLCAGKAWSRATSLLLMPVVGFCVLPALLAIELTDGDRFKI